jgi:glycosyltransferase involved in cell wall biosynthesis
MRVWLYLKNYPTTGALNEGTSLAVSGLAGGFAHLGVPVTVLCEGHERISSVDPLGYSVECFAGRNTPNPFAIPLGLQRYFAENVGTRETVVVLNGMFHPRVSALGRLARRHAVPYVIAPHDPYAPAVFSRNPHVKWPYWYALEKGLLKKAAAVQVLDPTHGGFLRALGVDTPIIETENGVTPDRAAHESDLRWSDAGEPIRLFYLGRFDVYNKGLDILLDAFSALDPDATISLTLQGPDVGGRAAMHDQVASRGLEGKVHLIPPDYSRSPADIMLEYDVFCQPSRFEGFGLASLEAMLAGRVLLVSRGAGIARHVVASGCGVTVSPDLAGVVRGLKDILNRRPSWREMGLAGRNYALETLDWDRIAGRLIPRYESILLEH